MQGDEHTCQRPGCHCTVAAEQTYCSEICRTATERADTSEAGRPEVCDCGHPECREPI